MSELRVRLLREGAVLPVYATEGAAGLDLSACLGEGEAMVIEARGGTASVPTGIAIALPPRHEGQVRPRSGLAAKHGVTVLNAPGTIDEDYRGEVRVLLINHGREPFVVRHGERIAQLVVAPVTIVRVSAVDALEGTPRGEGGFGSTGR